jgi:hypothetical protein
MKKCPYCGKEYPDDAVVCELDQNPLASPKSNGARINLSKSHLKQQPITTTRILSVFGFSVLSGLCGVGLTSVVLGFFANHNPRFSGNGDRVGFLADSATIIMIGGIVGFIVGLVISLKAANANPKIEEEIERKYVGGAGRMQIYFGAPVFIIAVLGKMFFEKLLNGAGTETGV